MQSDALASSVASSHGVASTGCRPGRLDGALGHVRRGDSVLTVLHLCLGVAHEHAALQGILLGLLLTTSSRYHGLVFYILPSVFILLGQACLSLQRCFSFPQHLHLCIRVIGKHSSQKSQFLDEVSCEGVEHSVRELSFHDAVVQQTKLGGIARLCVHKVTQRIPHGTLS